MHRLTGGLCDPEGTWDRRRLWRRSTRVAAALTGLGVRAGDRVLLAAENSADQVAALLALIRLDTSLVLFDPAGTAADLARATAWTGARVVLVDRTGPDAAPRGGSGVPPVVSLASLVGTDPDWPVGNGRRADADRRASGSPGPDPGWLAAWRRRDDALLTFSSGSTGQPRCVVRSGAAFLDNVTATVDRMDYTAEDVLLPLLPFSHQYGLSLVMAWWLSAATLAVGPYRMLDRALAFGARVGATVVDGTPATYATALDLAGRVPALLDELAGVRLWCVGGAPLDSGLAGRFAARTGRDLIDGYGSTEAGNVALATPENPVGCGRPLPGVGLRIVAPDGADLPPGVTGEIVLDSPALFSGHLADDGRIVPRRGVHHTNDLGHLDAAGNLFVLGRRLAVHRAGHTIYPAQVERRASECGRPVRVLATPDRRLGSRLVLVVADPQGRPAGHWRRIVNELLAEHERPNRVVVVDRFPVGATGKVDTAALRRMVLPDAPEGEAGAARDRAEVTRSAAPGDRGVVSPARAAVLREVADWLAADPEPVVEILTAIAPRAAVALEIEAAVRTLRGAAAEVARHRPPRVSRLAVFMSSNMLLYSYVLYLLVPALFTEHLVFRPSSQVEEPTVRLHELLSRRHGLPVTCRRDSQRAFVRDDVRLAEVAVFTGTYGNAEQVRAQLRDDQLLLFFGQGVNPFIVTSGADIDTAVEDAIRIRLLNSGQDCLGPDVHFVPHDDLDRFVDGLGKRLAEQRYGPYRDPDADYGPLYYDTGLAAASGYLSRHRGAVAYGGRVDYARRWVEPTVVVQDLAALPDPEELFAPIFTVVGYDRLASVRHLLARPAYTDRALGAMVYGDAPELVDELSRRHTVAVNRTLLEVEDGNAPFGGHGIMAGYAAYRGRRVTGPLLVSKAVAEHLGVPGRVDRLVESGGEER